MSPSKQLAQLKALIVELDKVDSEFGEGYTPTEIGKAWNDIWKIVDPSRAIDWDAHIEQERLWREKREADYQKRHR